MNELILPIILAFIASTGFWAFITNIYNRKADKNDRILEEISKSRQIELAISRELLDAMLNKQIEKGYCPTEELRKLNDFYSIYKALGGNSYIVELMERVESLPKGQKKIEG